LRPSEWVGERLGPRRPRPEELGKGAEPLCFHYPPGDWRREALADFGRWLEEEPQPGGEEGVPAASGEVPPARDLFGTAADLAALRQEFKRYSRVQNRQNEQQADMLKLYRETLDGLQNRTEEVQQYRSALQRDAEREAVLAFADVRDTLKRGLEECRGAEPVPARSGWFGRKATAPDLEPFRRGFEMALERFDRVLGQFRVQPVETVGREFDSRTMVAVATRSETGVSAGTVVEELAGGYLRGEEVLRPAQVVVANETEF
jgi:molecular chaperone GrpE (heat shock protein)